MSECLTGNIVELDEQQVDTVRQIGQRALAIAQYRYCSGFPDYQGGTIQRLGFNNARHDQMVGDDAVRLGDRIGLSTDEQELARTIGYAHDIVQLKGRGTDEQESADWVEKQLRDRNMLPAGAAKLASAAIIATEPLFKDGAVVGQRVDEMEFDSFRHELFARTIVSADLGELYSPISPYLSHKLYVQRQELDAQATPSLDGLLEFQRKQTSFLEAYTYPLQEAENVFATHRRQVIDYAYHLYEQLERGDVTTWERLLAQDLAFMHHPDRLFDQLSSTSRI